MQSPPYTLHLTDEHWQAIQRLPTPAQQQDATDFLMTYVVNSPTRRMPNGDLKELKGTFKGYWQYDIDRSYRIIYTIDESAKEVRVEYIGNHPNWGGRSGQRRIRP